MVSTRSANKSPTAAVAAATSPSSASGASKRGAPADAGASPAAKKQAVGLTVGAAATTDVTLVDQSGASVRFLDTFQERGVVFFMYPKANTPGCTKQACGFRDHIQEIRDAGFAVYGLSADSPKVLANWKTKEGLSYDLLSDPKHELIKYFGSSVGGAKVQRSHVVILKGGVVGDIQGKVSPAESVDRAVAFVTANKQSVSAAPPAEAEVEVEAEVPAAAPGAPATELKTLVVGESVSLELELSTHASETVAVQSLFKDRGAIFFMYPKADTPGCTVQACGFNDHLKEINDAGFDVYGLGADTPTELLAWKQAQSYAYTFLSDPTHALIGYFGSSANDGTRVDRSHVVVLPGGKVGQLELKVSPQESVSKALEFVKAHAVAQ
ncbi:hypothetical protein PybrP1_003995 [[Pythium] brassicae (nom. inval.)]|nr:hypothetical protein PybrP1_003995 [[Pythium] brassicae (nom. inval.)]